MNAQTLTQWIYEAARIDALLHQRPIVPEPWESRDEKFRQQMTEYVGKLLASDLLPTPEQAHDSWVDAYKKMGWTYGPSRDVEKKTIRICYLSTSFTRQSATRTRFFWHLSKLQGYYSN